MKEIKKERERKSMLKIKYKIKQREKNSFFKIPSRKAPFNGAHFCAPDILYLFYVNMYLLYILYVVFYAGYSA